MHADDDSREQVILTYVRAHFGRSISGADIGPETPLFSSNLIDSFGVLELIAFIEGTFHVEIELSAHDLEDFDTAKKIVALVRTLPLIGT